MEPFDLTEIQSVLEKFKTPSSKKKRALLIRHGQSEGNVGNFFYGSTDLPLTDVGIFQAQVLGKALEDYVYLFNYIKSSSMTRALQTMDNCVDMGAKNIVSDFRNVEIVKESNTSDSESSSMEKEFTVSEEFKRVPALKNPSKEEMQKINEIGLDKCVIRNKSDKPNLSSEQRYKNIYLID